MTPRTNAALAAGAWLTALLRPIPAVVQTSHMAFGNIAHIYHCFCDHLAVVQASCSDTTPQTFMGFCIAMVVSFLPLLLVLISYTHILAAVLRISSREGRSKAFSTCSSHLLVVGTYYSSIAIAYVAYRADLPLGFHIMGNVVDLFLQTPHCTDALAACHPGVKLCPTMDATACTGSKDSSPTFYLTFLGFCIAMVVSFLPLLLVLISYTHILAAVLRISSREGRSKAFSTCSSHLLVVGTYYSSIAIAYVAYRADLPLDFHIMGNVVFAILTPVLNPLIYTLRNKDVKAAISKMSCPQVPGHSGDL
ncbi:Olfactory receptor 2AT4 [Manis javanica]|nr:Olfactory receptor 2AT4 [Manis javanica]